MRIIDCVWDYNSLGVETFEIVVEKADDKDVLQTIIDLMENHAKYIVIKIPVNRVDLSYELAKLGLVFVETQISLKITTRQFETTKPHLLPYAEDIDMRKVESQDELESLLENVSDSMFTTDRIAIHPAFGISVANMRYKNWIVQKFTSPNVLLYETFLQNQPVGFAMHHIEDKTVSGLLGGIYSKYQDSGLFFDSVYRDLERYFSQGYKKFQTKISSNNISVMKLYMFLGFQIIDVQYVFHTVEW